MTKRKRTRYSKHCKANTLKKMMVDLQLWYSWRTFWCFYLNFINNGLPAASSWVEIEHFHLMVAPSGIVVIRGFNCRVVPRFDKKCSFYSLFLIETHFVTADSECSDQYFRKTNLQFLGNDPRDAQIIGFQCHECYYIKGKATVFYLRHKVAEEPKTGLTFLETYDYIAQQRNADMHVEREKKCSGLQQDACLANPFFAALHLASAWLSSTCRRLFFFFSLLPFF